MNLSQINHQAYVVHTASPYPPSTPKDENELIKPAVNGTLFVLKACVASGNRVKRVVLTVKFYPLSKYTAFDFDYNY